MLSIMDRVEPNERENEQEKGLIGDFCAFLMENKKFWLLPIVLVLLLLVVVFIRGGVEVAPFVYDLF